jgi:hypothetical protein
MQAEFIKHTNNKSNKWIMLSDDIYCLFHYDFFVFKKIIKSCAHQYILVWWDGHLNISPCTYNCDIICTLKCETVNRIFKFDNIRVNNVGNIFLFEIDDVHMMVPNYFQNNDSAILITIDNLKTKNKSDVNLVMNKDNVLCSV